MFAVYLIIGMVTGFMSMIGLVHEAKYNYRDQMFWRILLTCIVLWPIVVPMAINTYISTKK